MNTSRSWLALFVGLCVSVATTASASTSAVVFDNYGPDNTYTSGGTWLGNGNSEDMFAAQSFVPSQTGPVTKIEAAMFISSPTGVVNQVALSILTGVGTGTPASTTIWSQSFTGAMGGYKSSATFNLINGPTLQAGVRYWLYAQPPTTGFRPYSWYDGYTGTDATAFYFQRGTRDQTWQVYDPVTFPGRAMRVTALVPEPTSTAALALAVTAASIRRRLRERVVAPRACQ